MIKKILHIIIGWAKSFGWIETTIAEEKLSELRLKKCMDCMDSETSKILKIVKGTVGYENVIKCKICGCPCKQKSLVVDESCPKNKW